MERVLCSSREEELGQMPGRSQAAKFCTVLTQTITLNQADIVPQNTPQPCLLLCLCSCCGSRKINVTWSVLLRSLFPGKKDGSMPK